MDGDHPPWWLSPEELQRLTDDLAMSPEEWQRLDEEWQRSLDDCPMMTPEEWQRLGDEPRYCPGASENSQG